MYYFSDVTHTKCSLYSKTDRMWLAQYRALQLPTENPGSVALDDDHLHHLRLQKELADQILHVRKYQAVCKKNMRKYQAVCKKSRDNTQKALWEGAKEIVLYFFNDLRDAKRHMDTFIPAKHAHDHASSLGMLQRPTLDNNRNFRDLIQNKFDRLNAGAKQRVNDLVKTMEIDWRQCYFGRSAYRVVCEPNRDSKHDAAYWYFKVAASVSHILSAQGVKRQLFP